MTNREKLIKTNIYDLLCTIQKALIEDGCKISGLCVIEDIEKKPRSCPEGSPCGGNATMDINRKHTVTTKFCPHCGYKMGG